MYDCINHEYWENHPEEKREKELKEAEDDKRRGV